MSSNWLTKELQRYGPNATERKQLSARASRRYCRRLARRHYENFTVASRLVPRSLRQHFYNTYAYCRWADDLADEAESPQQSLALLEWWEAQLHACYAGKASHPVFIALSDTIERFNIPSKIWVDLLVAFRQDQRTTRYKTFDELLEYCRYSANPVGHLVLYLGRCFNPVRANLSDSICTGLQLANFWQDVASDWDRGRIYLPKTHRHRFGYTKAMFAERTCNEVFRQLLAAEVETADEWLRRGLPLVRQVPEDLQLSIALFIHGGLAILQAIRRQNFDVWSQRPTVSRWEKYRILADCWWRLRRGTFLES